MNDATLLGLKPRAFDIFNALVTAYLGSGQPIGSKTLAQRLRHDLSPASIAKASVRGVYRSANVVDLSRLPSSMADASYGALVCVGVMSYLPDTEAICREFCRLTVPGAPIVVTQRDDLFTGRDTQGAFDLLSRDGLWQQIEVTGPLPYLPGNPEFEGVGVHYCVFKRL